MTVITSQDPLYVKALMYALNAHQGQFRDYSKQQFLHHMVRVSEYVHEHFTHRGDVEELRAIALLHDIIEDTWVTAGDLRREFDSNLVSSIQDLSHSDGSERKTHDEYKEQLRRADDQASIVKLADIWDNTHDEMDDPMRYKRYLEDSLDVLDVIDADDEAFRERKEHLDNTIRTRLQEL